MTLLITVFAAVIVSVLWYIRKDDTMNLSPLMYMYWGASLMWLCDAVNEYLEVGSEYFNPTLSDLISDTYIGLSAIALGLVIWLVILFIKDPKGTIAKTLIKKK